MERGIIRAIAVACFLVSLIAHAGPAEIAGLEAELATVNEGISLTQEAMRKALKQYDPDAGDHGVKLRYLKREQTRLKNALQAATQDQQNRDARTGTVPSADPRRPQSLGRTPTATMVPAPAL